MLYEIILNNCVDNCFPENYDNYILLSMNLLFYQLFFNILVGILGCTVHHVPTHFEAVNTIEIEGCVFLVPRLKAIVKIISKIYSTNLDNHAVAL